MELDLSWIDRLAHRGIEGEEKAAEKDRLVEQGFTILEGEKTPFDAPAQPDAVEATPAQTQPAKRQLKPFNSIDGTDYRCFYRLACNYHEKFTPPRLTPEYWKNAANELMAISNENGNNDFLSDLLVSVYMELEREYLLLRDGKKGETVE